MAIKDRNGIQVIVFMLEDTSLMAAAVSRHFLNRPILIDLCPLYLDLIVSHHLDRLTRNRKTALGVFDPGRALHGCENGVDVGSDQSRRFFSNEHPLEDADLRSRKANTAILHARTDHLPDVFLNDIQVGQVNRIALATNLVSLENLTETNAVGDVVDVVEH